MGLASLHDPYPLGFDTVPSQSEYESCEFLDSTSLSLAAGRAQLGVGLVTFSSQLT